MEVITLEEWGRYASGCPFKGSSKIMSCNWMNGFIICCFANCQRKDSLKEEYQKRVFGKVE